MDLDKNCLDFGMFTNNPEAMHNFYSGEIGLKFDGTTPMGPKFKLSRYQLNGSVLKLWHAADPLPPRAAAGFKSLTIADPKATGPRTVSDPDGNQLHFVPPGHNQVDQIEFHLGVSDLAAAERFYGEVLGAERIGAGRYRLGQTILSLSADAGARQVKTEALVNPLDAVVAMSGVGFRYLTIQVRDGAAEYHRLMAKGGVNPGVALTTGAGPLLALFMVRDPDGNWVEVLQRK
jgi:catechol 2,3-dioxygenase-like lactoylglutathione lyase family enzyme